MSDEITSVSLSYFTAKITVFSYLIVLHQYAQVQLNECTLKTYLRQLKSFFMSPPPPTPLDLLPNPSLFSFFFPSVPLEAELSLTLIPNFGSLPHQTSVIFTLFTVLKPNSKPTSSKPLILFNLPFIGNLLFVLSLLFSSLFV